MSISPRTTNRNESEFAQEVVLDGFSRTNINPDRKKKKKSTALKRRNTIHISHKHRHRRTKIDSGSLNYDNCDGVVHVVLTEEVQKLLKCLVGEDVTAEKPWTHINKFFIQEQVESEDVPEEFLTFLPYKLHVSEFQNDYMMIGYIPDESRDYDEFYFCLTAEAEEAVTKIVKKQEVQQQARLENTINKRVGIWTSLGSNDEIDEGRIENTRGLYRIEFEARYPIIYADVKFRFRWVNQARDGYAELKTMPRYLVPIVHKKRIDRNVQVAPAVTENVAQTFCSYPRNAWTQYEYECKFVQNLSKEFMEMFRSFKNTTMDNIQDVLCVNEKINFYSNDYMDLKNKEMPTLFETTYQEYQSFEDVKRCKGKMISALSWHPMWTGTIAIAYADISPRWYQNENRDKNVMEEVVHGFNPILIWSFKDSLNPKLILETNSEVHCLAFCPQDPNLLIGGCANGQIVLWDIKNKLNKVETEEVLTPAQQAYRTRLYSEMAWMKNTRDYTIVPPTAFSQLLHSHMNNVTAVAWLHPLYSLERTGKIRHCEEDDEPTLQFITSSSDGTLRFWDLRQKPVIDGDYRPQRKSRRLGKRPSALTLDVSPYRILNRRLLPHYELDIMLPGTEKMCAVAAISVPSQPINYQETAPNPNRVFNITDRIIYEPIFTCPLRSVKPIISLGTYTGDFMTCSWEGFEYTSGDVYTKEETKFLNVGKYHDGPVLTCERHPDISDVYLTIGGKIFCIWLGSLKGRPVFWRRSRNKYTHGNWESNKCAGFRFTASDGSREFWNLDFKSDGPYSTQMYSGKPLLEGLPHTLPMKNNRFVGIADDRGTLRLIYSKVVFKDQRTSVSYFRKFLNNNADRKLEFEAWQTNWTDKHASWIKEQREAELAEQARLRAEELERQAFEEEQRLKEAVEEAKREAAKQHAPQGKFEDWARERWILKEQERMGNELLSNKRLDKETLMKQQLPLKRLEVEAAKKQQKIKQRHLKVDEIFMETIAMLFPNLAEKRDTDEMFEKVYTEAEISDMQQHFLAAYDAVVVDSEILIENNPFIYQLDWKRILAATKSRKIKEEFRYLERHSDRYRRIKVLRDRNSSWVSQDSSNKGLTKGRSSSSRAYFADESLKSIAFD